MLTCSIRCAYELATSVARSPINNEPGCIQRKIDFMGHCLKLYSKLIIWTHKRTKSLSHNLSSFYFQRNFQWKSVKIHKTQIQRSDRISKWIRGEDFTMVKWLKILFDNALCHMKRYEIRPNKKWFRSSNLIAVGNSLGKLFLAHFNEIISISSNKNSLLTERFKANP